MNGYIDSWQDCSMVGVKKEREISFKNICLYCFMGL